MWALVEWVPRRVRGATERALGRAGSGPRQQVATYEQLAFDARQRGLEVPSFLTFALASYQQEGTTKQVPSTEAVQKAVREGSPLLCAALQDVEGNMAGEGKLLNIYWLLSIRRTIDLKIPGRRGRTRVATRASRRRYCRVY